MWSFESFLEEERDTHGSGKNGASWERKVEVLKVKKGRLSIGKQERSKLVSLKERYVFIFLHTLIVIISQSISFLSYILIRYRNSLDLGRIIKITLIVDDILMNGLLISCWVMLIKIEIRIIFFGIILTWLRSFDNIW